MEKFIPVNTPLFSGNEKKYLLDCIDSGWVSSEGPYVEMFESMLSSCVGQKYGVAVSNGTAALEIAVAALGIGAGDEVILPSHTIISCAQAVVKVGAIPVLIDSNINSWNMDVSAIESKITNKTKAIMVVHLYGHPVDMDVVLAIANKYKLAIIEDTAQMLGQQYKGRPCGSFGDISTFSFYPNKQITTGEGGMCVTSDYHLAERCKTLRNLCFGTKRFIHDELGWNYRMTNIQAALGVAQIEKLNEHVLRKREIGEKYTRLLTKNKRFTLPLQSTGYSENIYWVYGLLLNPNEEWKDAESCMQTLLDNGVGVRPFFCPMHNQPVFRARGLFENEVMPIAEEMYSRGFYIPSGIGISDSDIEVVANKINDIFG